MDKGAVIPPFHSVQCKDVTYMDSTLYEKLGTRLARHVKGSCSTAETKQTTTDFIKLYEKLPLFLVGFDDDDLYGSCSMNNEEEIQEESFEFHLPFKHILLEFPKLSRESYSHLESIQYSKTYHPMIFVTEVAPRLFSFDVLTLSEESLQSSPIFAVTFSYNIPPSSHMV